MKLNKLGTITNFVFIIIISESYLTSMSQIKQRQARELFTF